MRKGKDTQTQKTGLQWRVLERTDRHKHAMMMRCMSYAGQRLNSIIFVQAEGEELDVYECLSVKRTKKSKQSYKTMFTKGGSVKGRE